MSAQPRRAKPTSTAADPIVAELTEHLRYHVPLNPGHQNAGHVAELAVAYLHDRGRLTPPTPASA